MNPEQTRDKNGGYTRLGFSEEERLAKDGVISIANELKLSVKEDMVGNIIAVWNGNYPELPSISIGSHVDTVKCGGSYDGTVGVLAGFGAIKLLKSVGYVPKHSVEVICFSSEESSRFGVSTIGSKAMTGKLDIDKVKDLTDSEGISLKEALQTQGLDITKVYSAERQNDALHSFIELHIEQGKLLEEARCPIGIVTGIASPLRLKVNISGMASHSGTSPMGKRQDALASASKIINFVEEMGLKQSKKDHFVSTVTVIDTEPNVMNVIPSYVSLGIDIRSTDDQLKMESYQMIKKYCNTLSVDRNVSIKIMELSNERAVFMNNMVMEDLKQAVKLSNNSFMEMTSGAGHDSMNTSYKWPTGLMFIPCRNGVSHHPDEHAEISHIQIGVEVLSEYIKIVDNRVGDSSV